MASVTKYVDLNTIFDSSTSFLKNTTFDSSIYINVVGPEVSVDTPYAVITLGTGTNQLIRYRQLGDMAWEASTNYASTNYVDIYNTIQDASLSIALAGTTEAWNGLTKTDGSIGLGGALELPTTITTDVTNTLTFSGLQTSVSDTPLAVVQDTAGTSIKTRQLGDMSWETAADYATVINVNTYNSIQDASISSLDASIVRIDNYNSIQDASIVSLDASIVRIDAYNIVQDTYNSIQDASIVSLDASIVRIDIYDGIQDASILALESDLGNYVLKTGDSMTGQLDITGGGFSVGSIGVPYDSSFYSNVYVHNDLTIGGDLTVDGSIYVRSVETIDVSSGFIHLNTGQSGDPAASMQSGIIIDRGDNLNPYVFLYDESTQAFRIGIATQTAGPSFDDASTQAVATREDNPIVNAIPFWNNTVDRFDTDASLNYNAGILNTGKLTVSGGTVVLNNLTTDGGETTGLLINGFNQIVRREFGTGAFATIGDYALTVDVDAYNSLQDVSIAINSVAIQTLDGSVGGHETSILDLSTNKLDAIASTIGAIGVEVYSGEANNIGYIKRIVAGSGAVITGDASTINISVSGAATSVNKYADTLDGTAATSKTILQTTHLLPAPGPYHVTVYENDGGTINFVQPGISYNSSGDVTIRWTSGSLTADCSVFITG